jgi:ABC-type sugar transport system ATPase subunit
MSEGQLPGDSEEKGAMAGRSAAADASPPPRVRMSAIDKRYGAAYALRGVGFEAQPGEIHALVGENGAGKSTLMKVLAGAVAADGGHMEVDGLPYAPRSPHDARRQGIRAVHQEFSLVPHLSVAENLLLGELPTHRAGVIDWRAAHRAAAGSLEELGFAGMDTRQRVDRLGVSQRQMVEIAKALRGTPRVVILDEPSAVLTNAELEQLFTILRAFRASGGTAIYVSHRLDEVLAISDRVTVLKDGERVGTRVTADISGPELIRMMVGRPLTEIYPHRQHPPADELLVVRGLRGRGFADVDLAVRTGEIVGIFGLVGAGRTELARTIFGASATSGGSMTLGGLRYAPRSPGDALRSGVAMLGEDRSRDGLVLPAAMLDNLTLASLRRLSRIRVLDRGRQRSAATGQVDDLDIRPPRLGRPVRMLSGGNQQKVVFGKWLIHGARVQILDEPTRGVDVATKVQIYQLIGELADQGLAVLLISSDLPEIIGMSDRILVMRHGRLVGEVDGARATEERLLSIASGVAEEAA